MPAENVTCVKSGTLNNFVITLVSFIAFIAVMGNGIVIYVICTRKRLQRVIANCFVLSLAGVDFLVGLFVATFYIICHFWSGCQITIFNMFFNMFTLVSVANIFIMTLDRFIAIVHPLRYLSLATSRRVLAAVITTWVLPTILSFTPLLWMFSSSKSYRTTGTKIQAFIAITMFEVMPTVTMPFIYARIFFTVRRHARLMALQTTQLEYNSEIKEDCLAKTTSIKIPTTSQDNNKNICKGSPQYARKRRLPEHVLNITVLGTVIAFFELCWSLDIVVSFCKKLGLCVIDDGALRVSDVMIFTNSAINPVVYALLKNDIRREMGKLWPCTHKNQVIDRNDLNY